MASHLAAANQEPALDPSSSPHYPPFWEYHFNCFLSLMDHRTQLKHLRWALPRFKVAEACATPLGDHHLCWEAFLRNATTVSSHWIQALKRQHGWRWLKSVCIGGCSSFYVPLVISRSFWRIRISQKLPSWPGLWCCPFLPKTNPVFPSNLGYTWRPTTLRTLMLGLTPAEHHTSSFSRSHHGKLRNHMGLGQPSQETQQLGFPLVCSLLYCTALICLFLKLSLSYCCAQYCQHRFQNWKCCPLFMLFLPMIITSSSISWSFIILPVYHCFTLHMEPVYPVVVVHR